MDKGKYFEWLCLGGGAITGEDVTDLPRLANGRKSIDQIRIEEQAERFKRLFTVGSPEFMGFSLDAVQLDIRKDGRKGTIDFTSIELADGSPWINDLKLTRDAESTRSEYGYGHDWSELDLIQLIHYADLFHSHSGIYPKIGLWVFDYSPEKRIKFGEIVVSQKARQAKELRFQTAVEVINLYKSNGWTKLPSENECRGCKLSSCSKRFAPAPLKKFIVNI